MVLVWYIINIFLSTLADDTMISLTTLKISIKIFLYK